MPVNPRRGQVVAVGTLFAVLILISVAMFFYELYTAQWEMRLLDEQRVRERIRILEAGFWRLRIYGPALTDPPGLESLMARLDGGEAVIESKPAGGGVFSAELAAEFRLGSSDIERLYLRYVGRHSSPVLNHTIYVWNHTADDWTVLVSSSSYEGYEDATLKIPSLEQLVSPEGYVRILSLSYAEEEFECLIDLLSFEAYVEDESRILVRVLNESPSTIIIEAVWVNSAGLHTRRSLNLPLSPGEERLLNLKAEAGGFRYVVKLVTKRGNIFQVTVERG